MRIKVLTAFIFVLFVMCSSLVLYAERPLSIKGLSEKDTAEYVNGLAMAFSLYDLILRMKEKPTLFCLPSGDTVSAQLLWNLASNILEGPHEKNIVAIATLSELQKKFPCHL